MNDKLTFTGERMIPGHPQLYAFVRIYKLVAEKYGNSEHTALDYGCGSGYGTSLIRPYFKSVAGIDVDSVSIEYCRAHFKADGLQFESFEPALQPYPDSSFNCIFSFQVFEHIPLDEVPSYIRYIWNMLKPGGHAVITTPNAANYHGGYSGNPFHHKEYTHVELQACFNQVIDPASFRILAVRDIPSTCVYTWVRRALANRKGSMSLAKLAAKPFRALEKVGCLRCSHRRMLKEKNVSRVVGSYYVEINKP